MFCWMLFDLEIEQKNRQLIDVKIQASFPKAFLEKCLTDPCRYCVKVQREET